MSSNSEYTLLSLTWSISQAMRFSSYLVVLLTLRDWKTILGRYSVAELADPTLSNLHAILKSQKALTIL